MREKRAALRLTAAAFAVALSLGLSGCGGGGGGSNVRPSTPPPPGTGSGGSSDPDVTFDSSDSATWSNDIGGTGGLIKDGTGTLVLLGTNTYTGGTAIRKGTLQIGNGGTSGSIVGNVEDDGTLVFDHSDELVFAGAVSGIGSLKQVGTGRLVLTGNSTYTGGTTISRGILQLGNGGKSGGIGGNITNDGALVFDRADDVTFAGVISGGGSLEQAGTGRLILTAYNTYSGGTTISRGTLQLGSGGTTGWITGDVADSGSLVFNRSDDVSFNGVISGSGRLEQAGNGTLYLTGANTYSGGTTISRGRLQIGDGSSDGSIIGNVTDNGVLAFDRTGDLVFDGVISGTGSLDKQGHGTLVLTGNNTYTGTTVISVGTLQIGDGGSTGTIVGDVVDDAYDGSLVFDRSNDWTYRGAISGGGSVVKLGGGTLAFGGNSTYTGGTAVKAGTLKILAGGSLGMATVTVGGDGQNAALEVAHGATVPGAIDLEDGGALDNAGTISSKFAGSSAVQGFGGPVTVVNHDGGLIEGDWSQDGLYTPAIGLGVGTTLTNDVGSTIRGYAGVQSWGVVNNIGGTITGVTSDGIADAAVVNNRDGGSISAGTDGSLYSITAIGIKTSANNAVINNLNGSTIKGVLRGVMLIDGGTVTNDAGSAISGKTGVSISSMSSATGTVINTGGSTITGSQAGVVLGEGGTVNNGAGSTIETTAAASGDCSVTLACSIYVPIYNDFGNYGSNGKLTLTNAGRIVGNVQMDPSLANDITLVAGGSLQGNLAIGTNAQSTLTLDGGVGTAQPYSSAVTGTTTFGGKLVKNGDGTWTIDDSDLQGVTDTTVNAGSLRATLTLSGNVAVNASGRLDGVPGLAGDLANAGTVAVREGDTMVGGDYSQASSGTLAISLGSKLDVTGAATISGGTLEITGADSGYVSNTHTDVLTAAGGVNGTFDRLVKDSGVVFTATTINYSANSVWLDTTGLDVTTAAAGQGVSYTPVSMGSAVRVQGTFAQLDDKIAASNLTGVSGEFLNAAGEFQQAPTLLAAQASLQSLSGELHAVSAAMTFEAIDASDRVLSDRFDSLLDQGTGAGVWMHNLSIGGDMARAGYGGVDFQVNGWLVGSDRMIGQSGMAGFAFGQSLGQQRLDRGFDHERSRSTEAMAYTGWLDGNRYALGRVGFGRFQQDVSRQILLGYGTHGVSTQYNGSYGVAYGESGLHFGQARGHVVPFVSVQYARIDRDGFAEQGAGGFGLRSNAQALDRWQAGLGVRAGSRWVFGGGRALDVSAHAQWQRTLASHGDAFSASFVGLEQWQPLVGIGLSRYSGLLGFNLDATLSNRTTLQFGYDYQVGQRDNAQALSSRLNVAF